jgi:hypothetical protein
MVKQDTRNSGTDNQNGFRAFLETSSTPKEINAIHAFGTSSRAACEECYDLNIRPTY